MCNRGDNIMKAVTFLFFAAFLAVAAAAPWGGCCGQLQPEPLPCGCSGQATVSYGPPNGQVSYGPPTIRSGQYAQPYASEAVVYTPPQQSPCGCNRQAYIPQPSYGCGCGA